MLNNEKQNPKSFRTTSHGVDESILTSDSYSTRRKKRKLVVLGQMGVGKSSIVKRFIDDTLPDKPHSTFEEIYTKSYSYKNEDVKMQIIDTAGQSEYTPALPNRYNIGVHGYLLVFSINDNLSFETVQHINKILLEGIGSKFVPRILVGNKTDLESEREVSIDRIKKLSKTLKCPYIECSAKEGGEEIDKIFYKLLKEIEKENNDEYPYDIKNSTVKINFIRKHHKKFNLLLLLLVTLLILLGIVSFIMSMMYIFLYYITIDAFVITGLIFSLMLLLTNFRSMRLVVKKLYQFMPSINTWTYATIVLNLAVIVLINIQSLISIKVLQYFEAFNPIFIYFLTLFLQIVVVVVNKNLEPLYEELSSMSPINQHLLIKI